MLSAPLVTVIIPTYNRPDFLKRTLNSIVNQTYANLQIIVVSNGKSEDNRNTALGTLDKRVRYFDQKNSGTPASPRNHGISLSKGKYISFCDDDDLWFEDKIEKQVSVLEGNLDYDLCFSKMLRFDGFNEWSSPDEAGTADFSSLLYVNTIPISSVMVRADFIRKIGSFSLSPQVGTSADYEFALRASLNTKLYFINENLIKYWSGDNRTTSIDLKRRAGSVFFNLKTILKIYSIIYKNSNTSFNAYIKPALFNIKKSMKVLTYINLQRFNLV